MKNQIITQEDKNNAELINNIYVLRGTISDGRFTLKMWEKDSERLLENEIFYFEKNRESYIKDKINTTYNNFNL